MASTWSSIWPRLPWVNVGQPSTNRPSLTAESNPLHCLERTSYKADFKAHGSRLRPSAFTGTTPRPARKPIRPELDFWQRSLRLGNTLPCLRPTRLLGIVWSTCDSVLSCPQMVAPWTSSFPFTSWASVRLSVQENNPWDGSTSMTWSNSFCGPPKIPRQLARSMWSPLKPPPMPPSPPS